MELLLTEAIRTYSSLENAIYELTFDDETIFLKFEPKNFYHLFGFQYLENFNTYSDNGDSKSKVDKAILFKGLKNYVVNDVDIKQNTHYSRKISTSRQFIDLKDRLSLARDLSYYLDTQITKNVYWKYTNEFGIKTHIKWDYLIEFLPHRKIPQRYYLFLRKDEISSYYVPVSLFKTAPNHSTEYSRGQSRKNIVSVTKRCEGLISSR